MKLALPVNVRIKRKAWRARGVRKSGIRVNGFASWGCTDPDTREIAICTGSPSKPIALKRQMLTLVHEAVHACFSATDLEETVCKAISELLVEALWLHVTFTQRKGTCHEKSEG